MAINSSALAQAFYNCREVSPSCPVEATVLGYYPNLGVNATLATGFGACAMITAWFGLWKKTWPFALAVVLGCLLEFTGYIGRILMHRNPWDVDAFELQMIVIILAPTIICVSIYLTLEMVCVVLNPSLSRIPPHLYLYIFLPFDIFCLILQGIGGGLAAAAGTENGTLLEHGNRTIIAGIALQVLLLSSFGAFVVDYFWRVGRYVRSGEASAEALSLWKSRRFQLFGASVGVAYVGILMRCIYRIIEMAGGWGNSIMRDEPGFIVLEGFSILIAVISLTVFPPGVLFPQMAEHFREKITSMWHRYRRRHSEKSGHNGKQAAKSPGAASSADKTVLSTELVTGKGDNMEVSALSSQRSSA